MIFAPFGSEALELPGDLARRPGWSDWSAGHETRLWHHATDVAEPFAIFCRQDEASIGFHFGTHAAARDRHAIMFRMGDPELRDLEGFMLSVVVRYRNALRLPDKHCWDLDQVTAELVSRDLLDPNSEDMILGTCDTQPVLAAIEAAGYDAILYPNETEGRDDPERDSLLVWRASQIRSVHASSFVEGCPLLCPTLVASVEEVSWWRDNERGIDEWLPRLRRLPDIAA